MKKPNELESLKMVTLIIAILLNLNLFAQKKEADCRVLLHRISESYEGGCKNGLAHGKGKAVGVDTYEGRFKKGLPHGSGTYTWKNGNIYTGNWKAGMRSGKGTLYGAANDEELTGFWKNDEFIKEIEVPQYRVVEQYNVQNVSVRKINDINNKVTVKLKRDGQIKSNQQDINIVATSGVLSKSQYFIYHSVIFPWEGILTFLVPSRFSQETVRAKVKVEIDKPGEWEILIDY